MLVILFFRQVLLLTQSASSQICIQMQGFVVVVVVVVVVGGGGGGGVGGVGVGVGVGAGAGAGAAGGGCGDDDGGGDGDGGVGGGSGGIPNKQRRPQLEKNSGGSPSHECFCTAIFLTFMYLHFVHRFSWMWKELIDTK